MKIMKLSIMTVALIGLIAGSKLGAMAPSNEMATSMLQTAQVSTFAAGVANKKAQDQRAAADAAVAKLKKSKSPADRAEMINKVKKSKLAAEGAITAADQAKANAEMAQKYGTSATAPGLAKVLADATNAQAIAQENNAKLKAIADQTGEVFTLPAPGRPEPKPQIFVPVNQPANPPAKPMAPPQDTEDNADLIAAMPKAETMARTMPSRPVKQPIAPIKR